MDQEIIDLTMLLIYLTGWEEVNNRGVMVKKTFRAFKGYRHEALDDLANRGLIHQVPGGKSLTVTEQGKRKQRN